MTLGFVNSARFDSLSRFFNSKFLISFIPSAFWKTNALTIIPAIKMAG